MILMYYEKTEKAWCIESATKHKVNNNFWA